MLFPSTIGTTFEPLPCVSSLFPPSSSFLFSLTYRADPFLEALVHHQQPVEDAPLSCVPSLFTPIILSVHTHDPGLRHASAAPRASSPAPNICATVPIFPDANMPTLLAAPASENDPLGTDGVAASVHNSYTVLDAANSRYTIPRSDRQCFP